MESKLKKMEHTKVDGPLKIITCMEQRMARSEGFLDNLISTGSFIAENLLLHIEQYQIPKGKEDNQSFTISMDVKQYIISIVEQYEHFHKNLSSFRSQINEIEFNEYRNEFIKLVQELKMVSRKLSAIQSKLTSLKEEAEGFADNILEGSDEYYDNGENSV